MRVSHIQHPTASFTDLPDSLKVFLRVDREDMIVCCCRRSSLVERTPESAQFQVINYAAQSVWTFRMPNWRFVLQKDIVVEEAYSFPGHIRSVVLSKTMIDLSQR
jgi:hypothetical protein